MPPSVMDESNDELLSPTDEPATNEPVHLNEEDDDDDDDDMDYEPATEGDENDDEDDEDFDEHSDTNEDLIEESGDGEHGGLEVFFSMEDSTQDASTNEPQEGAEGETEQAPNIHAVRISREDILDMLNNQTGFGRYLIRYLVSARRSAQQDEDDAEDHSTGQERASRRQRRALEVEPFKQSQAGTQLMRNGTFGATDTSWGNDRLRKRRLSRLLLSRELAHDVGSRGERIDQLIAQTLIPSSAADMIVQVNSRCYSGQFSEDGNFFFCCAQDFRVRMYDTSNPYRWKYYKTVEYPYGSWTITDASLSPDNKFLAYSSIKSVVCLAPTDPGKDRDPWLLDFRSQAEQRATPWGTFGIWSIRFSGDGRELVAGTQGHSVCVYDIESRKRVLLIDGHDDDVNAVCYGDRSSPHILFSGSDDATLKVWDRRSMADGRAAGVFVGHTEGLTYIDSKGDGRYVLSNGKDQAMKLWDLRKMVSADNFENVRSSIRTSNFDYRFMDYDPLDNEANPHDCSVVTFRGHRVLKTLIRCHFSPPGSTDSRFVYSGSEDGSVYIYNLDATLAGKVDVLQATAKDKYKRSSRGVSGRHWKTCVRDASWHPGAPIIAATSWNGPAMARGTCTIHSWNDDADLDEAEPGIGYTVNERLEEGPVINYDGDD